MKKNVIAFIRSLGGSAAYAGNTEKWTRTSKKGEKPTYSVAKNKATMFITDPRKDVQDIAQAVLNKFGVLPFTLKTN